LLIVANVSWRPKVTSWVWPPLTIAAACRYPLQTLAKMAPIGRHGRSAQRFSNCLATKRSSPRSRRDAQSKWQIGPVGPFNRSRVFVFAALNPRGDLEPEFDVFVAAHKKLLREVQGALAFFSRQ
jgi:hypothetical protein